jgi:hypothetical protein
MIGSEQTEHLGAYCLVGQKGGAESIAMGSEKSGTLQAFTSPEEHRL